MKRSPLYSVARERWRCLVISGRDGGGRGVKLSKIVSVDDFFHVYLGSTVDKK